ncbi:hypothetical protein GCM10010344_43360 [Streptomyces bluensis]|nr:hypothetical protein GCM10010344_43360 [Streptomyces bluensis]
MRPLTQWTPLRVGAQQPCRVLDPIWRFLVAERVTKGLSFAFNGVLLHTHGAQGRTWGRRAPGAPRKNAHPA